MTRFLVKRMLNQRKIQVKDQIVYYLEGMEKCPLPYCKT